MTMGIRNVLGFCLEAGKCLAKSGNESKLVVFSTIKWGNDQNWCTHQLFYKIRVPTDQNWVASPSGMLHTKILHKTMPGAPFDPFQGEFQNDMKHGPETQRPRFRRHMLEMTIFITGWWFGTFFIFPYIGNNHPN